MRRSCQGSGERGGRVVTSCPSLTRMSDLPGWTRSEFTADGVTHSTLTLHRQQEGVDRAFAFFKEKLTT